MGVSDRPNLWGRWPSDDNSNAEIHAISASSLAHLFGVSVGACGEVTHRVACMHAQTDSLRAFLLRSWREMTASQTRSDGMNRRITKPLTGWVVSWVADWEGLWEIPRTSSPSGVFQCLWTTEPSLREPSPFQRWSGLSFERLARKMGVGSANKLLRCLFWRWFSVIRDNSLTWWAEWKQGCKQGAHLFACGSGVPTQAKVACLFSTTKATASLSRNRPRWE